MDSTTKEDKDSLFLEQCLNKLYDFGNGAASKKRLKSQKKKKRKHCEEEEEESTTANDCGAACSVPDQQQQQPETEQTGAAVQQVSRVEVVTFQDPRKKVKTKQTPRVEVKLEHSLTEKTQSDQTEELNFEKARLEVHRFGITGYKKEQQRVFEQDRAIMLGARPPRKDFVNYKLLQQQIKEKKQKVKEEVQPDLKKKKKNNQRDKKKVTSGSGSAPTGQVGRFKNGMLILSSKEIQKIKGKKGGR